VIQGIHLWRVEERAAPQFEDVKEAQGKRDRNDNQKQGKISMGPARLRRRRLPTAPITSLPRTLS
jgi:hypothetical protein